MRVKQNILGIRNRCEYEEALRFFALKSKSMVARFGGNTWLMIKVPLTKKIILRKYKGQIDNIDLIINNFNLYYKQYNFRSILEMYRSEIMRLIIQDLKYYSVKYTIANFDLEYMKEHEEQKNMDKESNINTIIDLSKRCVAMQHKIS